jgi:hypothetical protein
MYVKEIFVFLILPLIIFMLVGLFHPLLSFDTSYPYSYPYSLAILELTSRFFLSILYGIYPIFVKTEKYFGKRGSANVVIEYQALNKLLIILTPLLTILILLFWSIDFEGSRGSKLVLIPFFMNNIAYLTIGIFLRIVTLRAKKEFRFYLAKGYCLLITEKKNELEKLKSLDLLLNSYNEYLERNLKIEIKDIEKIYSFILYKQNNERNEILNNICKMLENDRLSLGLYLKSLYNVSESEFYVKESLIKTLKVIGTIIIAAVPIIISIIQVITTL